MRISEWGPDVGSSELRAISSAWGSAYFNDFLDRGRTKRVYIQADEAYRSSPEGIENLYVRGTSGEMAPFRAFSTLSWKTAPVILRRYNGKLAMQLQGAPGQGMRTGDAMNLITETHGKLPPGTVLEWTGLSYEESLSGGQALMVYDMSLAIVFLCLSAPYQI